MTENNDVDTEEQLQKEILAWAKDYAASRGWMVNPNEKQLGAVIKGLARSTVRFDEQYCPCRMRTGDAEKDKEIICPCIYHEDEVGKDGHCHCHLFFAKEE